MQPFHDSQDSDSDATYRYLARMLRPSAPLVMTSSPGGITLGVNLSPGVLLTGQVVAIQVTGRSGNLYSWLEVEPQYGGPISGLWTAKVGGGYGSAAQNPAVEMNGSQGVPVGTVLFATPGPIDTTLGQIYVCWPYCCGSTNIPGGTPSGGGTTVPACCPGVVLPTAITLTLSGVTGAYASAINGVPFTLLYTGYEWDGTLAIDSSNDLLGVRLWCINGIWTLSISLQISSGQPSFIPATVACWQGGVSVTCSPFAVSQSGIILGCLPGAGSVTVATLAPGGGGGGGISAIALGTASSGGLQVASLTKSSVTVQGGSLLVVNVGSMNPGASSASLGATFGGTAMSIAGSTNVTGPGGADAGCCAVAYLYVAVTTTANVVVGPTAGVTGLMLSAVQISGLASNALDAVHVNSAATSAPDTGPAGPTSFATEYAQAAFLMMQTGGGPVAGGPPYAWAGGFAAGGQDMATLVSGNGMALSEGYRMLVATGTVDASITGATCTAWAGLVATFK